jgi:hypothetical protein
MATPWWLKSVYEPGVSEDNGSGGGAGITRLVDARTNAPVFLSDGKYYYGSEQDRIYREYLNGTSDEYPLRSFAPIPDESPKTATWLTDAAKGILAPYGNLGGEVGLVDGKATYLYPMDRGATIAGDIGMYGGAQRAQWTSPSGAKGTVVKGPDGNLWVQPPADARYSESDTADHSTMLGQALSSFGPLIMAALPFTGVGSALTGALGDIGGRAVLNAGTSLLTGGDPLKGALSGAVSAGVGAAMPGFDTGLGAPMDSALKGALTGGTVSALQGGNPLAGAIAGGGSSLFSSGMKSAASAGRDLVSNFSANPSPSTAVDTLAANTTGPNPAQAWGNSVDNMDSFLGQFAASPSPATADQTISGLSQQTAGQTSSGPFQQPASSLPWQTVSSNNYLQNPVTGGGNMAFFDEILGDYTVDPSQFWPTSGSMDTGGDYSSTSLFDPAGTPAANYLDYGMTYAPGGLNLGYTQDLSNSGNFIPDTASGGWDSFLKSMGASGIGQAASSIGKGLTTGISALGGRSILGTGLSIAPALAAINYATNQPGFDTSKLQSVYDQYNPSAQTGLYDIASQQQMSKLQSDLERRGVSGSSFGDQSIATQNTVRDLGRNALINQGLGGQAEIAAKMLDAQAKERAARNQLYGSALYSLGSALSPRNPMMG